MRVEDPPKSLSQLADEMEERKLAFLNEKIAAKSVFSAMGAGKIEEDTGPQMLERNPGKHLLTGPDMRLPLLPEKPTLMDFLKYRCASTAHLLQSARLARRAGLPDKIVFACLVHDIAVQCFIRCDHGYWAEQMLAPYVDEEVCWAVRMHQILRFFPDESVGYGYPEAYVRFFGAGYQPEPHVLAEYERARNHPWYMTARMITVFDEYAFDPDAQETMEDFTDLIGRHFRQPAQGLGFDASPSAHMWRTINWPTRFL